MSEAERRDRNYEVPVSRGPMFMRLIMVRSFLATVNRMMTMMRTVMVIIVVVRRFVINLRRSLLKMKMRSFVSMMAMPDNRAVPQ
jgi:hypothetical protein